MAWYETFFDENYLNEYATGLTPERARREVDFINRTLNLSEGARILDLCCGHGRHTVELAAAGYSMVGQDLSATFLALARDAAASRDLQIQFVHADMREIPFEAEFDAVINMFTAFGYFDDDTEDQKVLDAVGRALKPGGKFLIDLLNTLRIMRDFLPQSWDELPDGTAALTKRDYNLLTGNIEELRTYIAPDGSKREIHLVWRSYFYTELAKMLNLAGLMPIQVFGGFDSSEFTWDSNRMIVLAEKQPEA
jgi:SAM-dependent methyltransferase